jgi:hypothetical protein
MSGVALRRRKPCGACCELPLVTDLRGACSVCSAAGSVVPLMPWPFRCRSLDSGFGLATLVFGLDPQGWITFLAAILLALITFLLDGCLC